MRYSIVPQPQISLDRIKCLIIDCSRAHRGVHRRPSSISSLCALLSHLCERNLARILPSWIYNCSPTFSSIHHTLHNRQATNAFAYNNSSTYSISARSSRIITNSVARSNILVLINFLISIAVKHMYYVCTFHKFLNSFSFWCLSHSLNNSNSYMAMDLTECICACWILTDAADVSSKEVGLEMLMMIMMRTTRSRTIEGESNWANVLRKAKEWKILN